MVELEGPWAQQYGVAVEHPLSPVEQTLADHIAAGGAMAVDKGLSRLVGALARAAPEQTSMPPELVDGLAAWAGVTDPAPRLVSVDLPKGDCAVAAEPGCAQEIAALVEEVRSAPPEGPNLHFGVGVAALPRGATRMMVAVVPRGVQLEPIAVVHPSGDVLRVAGHLLGKLHEPRVELTYPGGSVHRVPVQNHGRGGFVAESRCDAGDGPYQLEVLAEGTHGPEVVANFPVFCGRAPPSRLHAELEVLGPGVRAEQIAQASFELINRARAQRDLPALQWDPKAAAVAMAHSQDMAEHRFVGHRSPTTGDVADRMAKAQVAVAVLAENVARGYGPRGIHGSLMRSPGHRGNIVAPDLTHVGIGVVLGKAESGAERTGRPVFLTQVFFRPAGPGPGITAMTTAALKGDIDRRRRAGGLPLPNWDRRLDRVAAHLVTALLRQGEVPAGWERKVFALGYGQAQLHRVQTMDGTSLAGIDLWRESALTAGVALGTLDDGSLLLVVITAAPS